MTTFQDNIYSGSIALTSALSSQSEVALSRTFRFTGGGAQTQTFVLPTGVQNLNGSVFIAANGSAATSDRITVSAAGTNIITFASMGSAAGVLELTTTSVGTKTIVASAAINPTTTAEVTAAVTLASVDTATDYQVHLRFTRRRNAEVT